MSDVAAIVAFLVLGAVALLAFAAHVTGAW
jgi:hypothetical protein